MAVKCDICGKKMKDAESVWNVSTFKSLGAKENRRLDLCREDMERMEVELEKAFHRLADPHGGMKEKG